MPDAVNVKLGFRNIQFARDDDSTIAIRRPLSVTPAIDPAGHLLSVAVRTYDVTAPELWSGAGAGELSLEVPVFRAPEETWKRYSFGRVKLVSGYPTASQGDLAVVTLVFTPADA